MNEKKLTVIGSVDPLDVVAKLKKAGQYTEMLSVGPAKEEKKKEEPKDGGKKDGSQQTKANPNYNNPNVIVYHYVPRVEEDQFGCVIC